jgi:hypothetical protein
MLPIYGSDRVRNNVRIFHSTVSPTFTVSESGWYLNWMISTAFILPATFAGLDDSRLPVWQRWKKEISLSMRPALAMRLRAALPIAHSIDEATFLPPG